MYRLSGRSLSKRNRTAELHGLSFWSFSRLLVNLSAKLVQLGNIRVQARHWFHVPTVWWVDSKTGLHNKGVSGSSQDQQGLDGCTSCSVGYYSSVEASFSCTACSPGYFSASNATKTCSICPVGKVQPLFGNNSCVACGSGSYSADEGRSDCKQCEVGRAQYVYPTHM